MTALTKGDLHWAGVRKRRKKLASFIGAEFYRLPAEPLEFSSEGAMRDDERLYFMRPHEIGFAYVAEQLRADHLYDHQWLVQCGKEPHEVLAFVSEPYSDVETALAKVAFPVTSGLCAHVLPAAMGAWKPNDCIVIVVRVDDYGRFLGWSCEQIAQRWRKKWAKFFDHYSAEMVKAELYEEPTAS